MITLGMMITLTFFPLLGGEVRQVREAMKTRGAGTCIPLPFILYWVQGDIMYQRLLLVPKLKSSKRMTMDERCFTIMKI